MASSKSLLRLGHLFGEKLGFLCFVVCFGLWYFVCLVLGFCLVHWFGVGVFVFVVVSFGCLVHWLGVFCYHSE